MIQESLKMEEEFNVGDEVLLSTYQGHTIFSIFFYNQTVFQQIYS